MIISGSYSNTVDFDPTSGVFTLGGGIGSHTFTAKYSADNHLIWAIKTGVNDITDIATDHLNNIYLTGYFTSTFDFDPDPVDTFFVTSSGSRDVFLLKYDSTGNFSWVKTFGGLNQDIGFSLRCDLMDNILVNGSFQGSVDFDPSPFNYIITSSYPISTFINKFNSNGDWLWAANLQQNSIDGQNSITVNGENKIIVAGNYPGTSGIDIDPTTDTLIMPAGALAFLAMYNDTVCSSLTVEIDSVIGLNCSTTGMINCHAIGGLAPYHYSWNTFPPTADSTSYFSTSGIYTISVVDSAFCTTQRSIIINGPSTFSNFDLTVDLLPTSFIPGSSSTLYVNGLNKGCTTMTGTIKLVLDTNTLFETASVTPSITSDTLIWNFAELLYNGPEANFNTNLLVSSALETSDSVCFTLIITPILGDFDSSNNIRHYCFPVSSPYDPNLKSVYPQGINTNHGILNNQKMTYTVQFQNTGTADAINIYVLDTLDPNLDLNTVNVIGSSHYMFTEVLPGNILKFHFPNINLPDSTTDEPNSHGYVIYEVDQLPDLPHNTIIENKAAIYFDYNDPVLTNKVFNTIDLGAEIYTSNDPLCIGDSTILTVVPHIPNLPASWEWHQGNCTGSLIGLGNNIIVTPTTTTAYYAKDTSTGLCFEQIISVNNVNTLVTNTDPTLTASATPATYQWVDCNAGFAPLSGQTNTSFTATGNGNYAVIVTENGCTDTSACYSIISTGISETPNGNVMVYPNPVNNELNIVFNNTPSPADITLTDMTGQVVFMSNLKWSNGQTSNQLFESRDLLSHYFERQW